MPFPAQVVRYAMSWRVGRSTAAIGVLLTLAACGSSGATSAVAPPSIDRSAANASVSQFGWEPMTGHVPQFACNDDSYAKAVKNGVTYGTYSLSPYSYKDASGNNTGFEWDLLQTTLRYAGISKVNVSYANFDTLIPAILAKRIDMMPAHETPARLKLIAFTAPVYWYGPVIAVPAGNPANIQTYADLIKAGITVGVVKGSAAQLYMGDVKGNIVAYDTNGLELQSLTASRESAVLEDAPTVAQFLKDTPTAKIEVLKNAQLDPATLAKLGYAYFEWGMNKDACSLNLAVSRALIELRANGVMNQIIAKDGLGGLAKTNIPGLSN